MPRLLLLALLCLCALPAVAQPGVEPCRRHVGMVASPDHPRVTFFDPWSGEVCAVIDLSSELPGGAGPPWFYGAALCPLSDGRLVGAVGDLAGGIHLIDAKTHRYLGSTSVFIPAEELACCGDFLLVTTSAAFPTEPVTVVDLADLSTNFLELDVAAVANACLPAGDAAVVVDGDGVLERLDLDLEIGPGGTLTGNATATPLLPLVSEQIRAPSVGPSGRCGTAVVDPLLGAGQPVGFDPRAPGAAQPVDAVQALAFLGTCTDPGIALVRTENRLLAYDQDRSCTLGALRFAHDGLPATDVSVASDSLVCAAGLVYVTVDRDEGTGEPDAVEVYRQSDGSHVATISGVEKPLGVAVYFAPQSAVEVPTLGSAATATFVLLITLLALGLLASRRRAAG